MRIAFRMQLFPGKAAEYKKRHDEIWPHLVLLLKEKGIRDYSIFLDERDGALFGVLEIDDSLRLEELPEEPVMKQWWQYMKEIMESNADGSPVSFPLKDVFYLP